MFDTHNLSDLAALAPACRTLRESDQRRHLHALATCAAPAPTARSEISDDPEPRVWRCLTLSVAVVAALAAAHLVLFAWLATV